MRSALATLVLALLAAATCALAAWNLTRGNLETLFGVPPTSVGSRLYSGFAPQEVSRIRIEASGITAEFTRQDSTWFAVSPWQDRMDPRAAVGIIGFTLGMRVEDLAETDDIDESAAGLADGRIEIQLFNPKDESLARYDLGSLTPWIAIEGEEKTQLPTVFVRTRDRGRKQHVYAATGDILPLFTDGLRFLRDHRPFHFHPATVRSIRIRSTQGDLTLGRVIDESISGEDFYPTVGAKFGIADGDADGLLTIAEFVSGDPDEPDDRKLQRLFGTADFNRDGVLSPEEFAATFLGAWRVVKPLDLGTDPAAIQSLIEGLYNLQAIRVLDRATTKIPTTDATTRQVALTLLGAESETILEIHPPASPEASSTLATVSNRPDSVFEIPLNPESGMLSLADLPLGVNKLRDPTLTNLNIAALQSITIKPSTGPPITVSRLPNRPWTVTIDGRQREANEARLFDLLRAVTSGRATGFESDAATDLSPWGLDRPFLSLSFRNDGATESIDLNFGLDGRGGFFVNRRGTPTVMRVDEALIRSIATQPFEWRHARIWNLSRVDLLSIEYTRINQATLILQYDWADEIWTVTRDGQDISGEIEPSRANFLLTTLENLSASRWLSATDETAAAALAVPSLNLVLSQKTADDFGDLTGITRRQLRIAPAPGDRNAFYGHLSGESHFFTIDRETAVKLAVDLSGKN